MITGLSSCYCMHEFRSSNPPMVSRIYNPSWISSPNTFTCQNVAQSWASRLNSIFYTSFLFKILKVGFKGALSGLRQFLASERPLEMMKNAFYFTLKALFILMIFKFLSWLFCHVEKRLDKKDKVNFKIYDVTTWFTNSYNTYRLISKEIKAIRQWSLSVSRTWETFFLNNHTQNVVKKLIPDPFLKIKITLSLDQ